MDFLLKKHIINPIKICNIIGIPYATVISKSRERDVVSARCILINLYSIYTDYTLKEIGDEFGGRDHSSVIHMQKRHKDWMSGLDATSRQYQNMFYECDKIVNVKKYHTILGQIFNKININVECECCKDVIIEIEKEGVELQANKISIIPDVNDSHVITHYHIRYDKE